MMSGYRHKPKTFLLTFEDPDLAGLEVRAKSVSVGSMLRLADLAILADADTFATADVKEVLTLFSVFAGCPQTCVLLHEDQGGNHFVSRIESWNLEDEDGNPVPATYEGLMTQDMGLSMPLVTAWFEGVAGTPAPLEQSSNGGGPSEEESIPMVPLSLAQVS